jgi:hypothetical protein
MLLTTSNIVSQQKTYDFSSTATPNRPLRGSTRTTRASHWRVSCSKLTKSPILSPIECVLSVSNKIPDVLMSRVVPMPSFNFTGRASLKRCPLRLSSKPPAPPTVRRRMPVIPRENNSMGDIFSRAFRYISKDREWTVAVRNVGMQGWEIAPRKARRSTQLRMRGYDEFRSCGRTVRIFMLPCLREFRGSDFWPANAKVPDSATDTRGAVRGEFE